jgi:hypothetical protein
MGIDPQSLGHFRVQVFKLRWEKRQLTDAEYSSKVQASLPASQLEKKSLSSGTLLRKMVSLLQLDEFSMTLTLLLLRTNNVASLVVLPRKLPPDSHVLSHKLSQREFLKFNPKNIPYQECSCTKSDLIFHVLL